MYVTGVTGYTTHSFCLYKTSKQWDLH